eukprot:PhM_4_TR2477/c0_g1_i1/m.6658
MFSSFTKPHAIEFCGTVQECTTLSHRTSYVASVPCIDMKHKRFPSHLPKSTQATLDMSSSSHSPISCTPPPHGRVDQIRTSPFQDPDAMCRSSFVTATDVTPALWAPGCEKRMLPAGGRKALTQYKVPLCEPTYSGASLSLSATAPAAVVMVDNVTVPHEDGVERARRMVRGFVKNRFPETSPEATHSEAADSSSSSSIHHTHASGRNDMRATESTRLPCGWTPCATPSKRNTSNFFLLFVLKSIDNASWTVKLLLWSCETDSSGHVAGLATKLELFTPLLPRFLRSDPEAPDGIVFSGVCNFFPKSSLSNATCVFM